MELITSQANKMLLFVEQFNSYDFSGRLFIPLEEREVLFSSFAELVLKAEQQFDKLKFPQKAQETRSFWQHKREDSPVQGEQEPPTEAEIYPYSAAGGRKKSKAKFQLHVYFRQNASWQGRIEWLDTKQSVAFRSTLELLHLVVEALRDTECVDRNIKRA